MQKEAAGGFLKLLFTKDRRISRIEEYHRRLGTLIASFQVSHNLVNSLRRIRPTENQISALLDVQAWNSKHDRARAADQQELNERLSYLERNNQQLAETLSLCSFNIDERIELIAA